MKIGCGAQLSELAAVRALGFDYVELRGKAVAALSEADFSALLRDLEALELPCPTLNAYCPADVVMAGPAYDRAHHRTYAAALADRARVLGVRVVGLGAPASRRLPEGFDRALAWRQALEFVADTADAFAAVGIRVGFEALGHCFCNFVNRMEEAAALVRALAPRQVGLILDFYNMEQSGEGDLDLTPFAPLLLHAHLSDDLGSCAERSFLHPDRYPLHGARVRRLLDTGYSGGLTLEVDQPVTAANAADTLAFLRAVSAPSPAQS